MIFDLNVEHLKLRRASRLAQWWGSGRSRAVDVSAVEQVKRLPLLRVEQNVRTARAHVTHRLFGRPCVFLKIHKYNL